MEGLVEIRWHGRGGQGAKTVALLFADAALGEGRFVQAFPEYGPERMGAPVQSFNRLSDEPIRLHCGVSSPQVVVVLDPTLMETVDVTAGLPSDGKLIINTHEAAAEIRERFKIEERKIFTVDASRISKECLGREIPNTPMLGALVKVTGLLKLDKMLADTREKLQQKFRSKPEMVEGNLAAIERAYDEVSGE